MSEHIIVSLISSTASILAVVIAGLLNWRKSQQLSVKVERTSAKTEEVSKKVTQDIIQTARVAQKVMEASAQAAEVSDKLDAVHEVVNGQKAALLAEIADLHKKVAALEAILSQRP